MRLPSSFGGFACSAALAAVALFAGLAHAVLVATGVSERAATTVYRSTSRRLMALATGPIAAVNGGLVLALASGGPGSGNGVVGGAGALVLGLIGMTFGGLALRRSRRIA